MNEFIALDQTYYVHSKYIYYKAGVTDVLLIRPVSMNRAQNGYKLVRGVNNGSVNKTSPSNKEITNS